MASQAYFVSGDDGDWDECVEDTTAGESPVGAPDKWRKIEIPAVFEAFVVSRATAILLPGDGQSDKARSESTTADGLLNETIFLHARTGSTRRSAVRTR